MKIAICYYSRHHGNTLKVLKAMTQAQKADLLDVTCRQTVHLDEYDCIGFASGIYGFTVQKAVAEFTRQYLPENKDVFFVYTYGAAKGKGAGDLYDIAGQKGCRVLGEFSCRGYDTFGPFRLMGGIAKGHPDKNDLEGAHDFYLKILQKLSGN